MSAEINEPPINRVSELPTGLEPPPADGDGNEPQLSSNPENEAVPRRQPIRLLSPRRTDIYFLRR
jgi:hypothetical protein